MNPSVLCAVTWVAQYAPHHSSFVPVYAAATLTPSSLNTGTQCMYSPALPVTPPSTAQTHVNFSFDFQRVFDNNDHIWSHSTLNSRIFMFV